MNLIRIKNIDNENIYINIDEISYFGYNKSEDTTIIVMNNNIRHLYKGDKESDLAKAITYLTKGDTVRL